MSKTQNENAKDILLAVDGSVSAKSATNIAVKFASALQWSIHAEYIVDVTQVFEIYGSTDQELSELDNYEPDRKHIKLFEEQGNLVLDEVESLCLQKKVSVTSDMIFGGIPNLLLDASKKYGLLALGRRGNRREHDSLGTNFRQIAHHVHTPLLIGSSDDTPRELKRVLLAYDGSDLARAALTWAERLQPLFSEVLVLTVEKEDEQDHAWLEARQKEVSNSALTHFNFIKEKGEPGQTISATAASEQVDFIVMGAYQHALFLEWARHSVIDTVLRESDLPILAVK